MTTYNTILDAEIAIDKPLTSTLATKIRDNPLAIQQGDVSAPRLNIFQRAVITTVGTSIWVRPPNITKIYVEILGGGKNYYTAGDYINSILNVDTDLTVVVGAGGAAGFASVNGGNSYIENSSSVVLARAKGGGQSTTSIGDFIVEGDIGFEYNTSQYRGGNTIYGSGGDFISKNAIGYGAGGGGGSGGVSVGKGGDGLVIIWY